MFTVSLTIESIFPAFLLTAGLVYLQRLEGERVLKIHSRLLKPHTKSDSRDVGVKIRIDGRGNERRALPLDLLALPELNHVGSLRVTHMLTLRQHAFLSVFVFTRRTRLICPLSCADPISIGTEVRLATKSAIK